MKKNLKYLLYFCIIIVFACIMGFVGWLYLFIVNTFLEFLWVGEELGGGVLYTSPILIILFTTFGAFLLSQTQRVYGVYPVKPKVFIGKFQKKERIEYNRFHLAFFLAMAPLFLGASVGPEASLVAIYFLFYSMTKDIDTYLEKKLGVSLIVNPRDTFKERISTNYLYTLKIILYWLVTLITISILSGEDHFVPFYFRFDQVIMSYREVVALFPLFVVGYFFTEFYWAIQRGVEYLMGKIKNDTILVTFTGLIIGICAIFFPVTIMSGEITAHLVVANSLLLEKTIACLLLLTVVKITLTHISIAGHIKGGPIYPIMFSCFLFGAAVSNMFQIDYTLSVLAILSVMLLRVFKSFPAVYIYLLLFFNIEILTVIFILLFVIKKTMKIVQGSKTDILEEHDESAL